MWKSRKVITGGAILLFMSGEAYAANLTVTVSGTVDVVKNINTTNKITLGNSIPNCTIIGSAGSINLSQNVATLNISGTYYLSVQNSSTVYASEVCVGQQANYKIYKTSVDGIGISYNDSDSASQSRGKPIPVWPQLLTKFAKSGSVGIGTWAEVRLWKYSSAANSLPFGVLNIQGPAVLQGVGDGSSDVMCNTMSGNANGIAVCYVNRIRPPQFTTSVYSSPCEFVNASKTVQMGKHVMPLGTPEGKGTPWVDASFQLRCSDAWGYSSDATNPNNLTKNNTVTVTVQPRDGFIDATNGIIKLDGTGAEGVGIQLAWGDYSSLGTVPLKPVKLNTPTNANTLSSHFTAGPYSIGGNAVSGDGSIKMAARYIRTGETLKPGLANAKVEIMANYQ